MTVTLNSQTAGSGGSSSTSGGTGGGSVTVNTAQNVLTSGALTALNATLPIAVGPQATVGVQVAGNGAGFVLQPQASMDDGATWINVSVIQAGAGSTSTPQATVTANGNFEFSTGGYTKFQLKTTTAATSGAVTVALAATPAQRFLRSTGIGDQGDAAATTTVTGSFSLVALLKGLLSRFLAFTPTASSGANTIAAANTDQTAVPANAARRFLSVTNTHASASLTINPVGPAYVNGALVGITLLPGDIYEWPSNTVPGTALHVASATLGASFFIVEG